MTPLDAAGLRALGDDRCLSVMSLRIFRAGLKHDLVDRKWPAFEEAFLGFVPQRVVALSDDDLDARLADPRLIRHGGKIRAIRDNAAAMLELAREHGSMGAWLADWPGERIVELWAALGARFKQLGGQSAPVFLRMLGKDTFLLTPDVTAMLERLGVVEAPPRTARDLATVQAAFNAWASATGRPLCQLSQILALARDD